MSCPEPTADYLPSCWRAGELIEQRCLADGEAGEECEDRAGRARQDYVDAVQAGWKTASGHPPDAWLNSGQCDDCFQAAFNYRPVGSAQYMMAVRDFSNAGEPERFRFGFIASSDIHTARPGSGYKEYWRGEMTEGRGLDPDTSAPEFLIASSGEPAAVSTPFDFSAGDIRGMSIFENERANAFFYTGGLVAVHSKGRDRTSIFEGLERREVYGTSGPRILLWFELLNPGAAPTPMGAATHRAGTPHFRVRAAGSFEQEPGCPAYAASSLGIDRLQALCRGECYNPSDRRRLITRIEIIRIRPQNTAEEPVTELIEDPWRTYHCPANEAGCQFDFDDPDFAKDRRDVVYYARAIEKTSIAIHGSNPLGCTSDDSGRCIAVKPCGIRVPKDDDCLAETEHRAWSSPIFVDYRE
jgi:hypothetical protein